MQLAFPLGFTLNGVPTAGATPTWLAWKRISNGENLVAPVIRDHGAGLYVFYWDAELSGEAHGVIDWGATVGGVTVKPCERYAFSGGTAESSRIFSSLTDLKPTPPTPAATREFNESSFPAWVP